MTTVHEGLVGQTATEISAQVRAGSLSATDVIAAHLARISSLDDGIGAFQLLRADKALAEAAALAGRSDLATLPLAGVPIAIKDSIDVAGEPTRHGSPATSDVAAAEDDELVRRLRAAGAVVIGKTCVPQLCMWGWTDSAFGITRSPWDRSRTAGGSSGGSAAAVASGMAPIALGSDGGGSIRIPAACCAVVGIKPGRGTVPAGRLNWYGLSERGPLATTVDDAALMLCVLAATPNLARPRPPEHPLRIALSVKATFPGAASDPDYPEAARRVASALADAGHVVEEADPDYTVGAFLNAAVRAFAGIAEQASSLGLRLSDLERRARPGVTAGRIFRLSGLVPPTSDKRWMQAAHSFFDSHDVLITPTLAGKPVPAEDWGRRSFLANARLAPFIPYTNVWNACGFPAAAVPVSAVGTGFPLSVQLVAAPGGEGRLLSVAKQIESLLPWTRHAPLPPVTSQ